MHPDPPVAAAGPASMTSRSANSPPSLRRSTSTAAIHSNSYAGRRCTPKHLRSQASLESLPDMISPEEYAALPASIQKKYFSSKERLCIAQQSAAQGRKKQHGKLGSWLSSTSTSDLRDTRPSTSGGLHSLKPKARPHDPKLFLVRFDDDSVSEEEASWFLSLPEKIKTKRFSREELVSLTARCHRVLGKSAVEPKADTPQRRRSVHRLEASACTPIEATFPSSTTSTAEGATSAASSSTNAELGREKSDASAPNRIPIDAVEISKIKRPLHDKIPVQTDQAVATALDTADAEMEILKLYLQRRSTKLKASENKAKRSLSGSSSTQSSQPTKRKANGRLPLLTPLPLPPPVLAPAPRPQTSTPFSTSARLSRPFLNTDPLALGEDTPSNEEGSAQPANASEEPKPPILHVEGEVFELPGDEAQLLASIEDKTEHVVDPHLVSAFSDDDTDDGDKVDDNVDTESVETVGPRTPSPLDHHDSAPHQAAAGDCGDEIPELHLDVRPKTPSVLDRSSLPSTYSSLPDSIGSRTHVVRSSSEEILYAYQRRITSGVEVETSDPLALQALPVCDDNTGAKGAFAVSHGQDGNSLASTKGLKRVFQSFKRL